MPKGDAQRVWFPEILARLNANGEKQYRSQR